jgi:HEAT repeat protein
MTILTGEIPLTRYSSPTQAWTLLMPYQSLSRLPSRRALLIGLLFAMAVATIAAIVFLPDSPETKVRHAYRNAFSGPYISATMRAELKGISQHLALRALTGLLEEGTSPFAGWYAAIYSNAPAAMQKHLSAPVDHVRILTGTLTTLREYGTNAGFAVPSLGRICEGAEPGLAFVRDTAASTLGEIGPGAAPAIPSLLKGVMGSNGLFLGTVTDALAKIDPSGDRTDQAWRGILKRSKQAAQASNLVASCVASLRHSRSTQGQSLSNASAVPWTTIRFFGFIRSEASQAVPGIRVCLQHSNERIRALAATTLGRIGPAASEALPELRTLLTDEWLMVRETATNAVRAIGR